MTKGGSTKKLVLLLLVSFAATASVVYQVRARRTVVRPPSPARGNDAAPPAPFANSGDSSAGAAAQGGLDPTRAEAGRADIPSDVWARSGRRNPFLTMEEVAGLNRPTGIATNDTNPEPSQPQPSALPTYSVSAIISGQEGNRAIIGSRVLQPGDRLGREMVKEITERSIVLEFEGRTRELLLRRLQNGIRQSMGPRGD